MVNGSGSSASGSGSDLTLNLALTFQTSFAGTKNVYMLAQDNGGLGTGWQVRGTWTVPGAGNQAPSAVSVTPSSGTGSSQTFSFLFTDANGYADLPWTQLLVNATLSGVSGCYIHFDRAANAVYLFGDAGPGWLGPLTLGAAGNLQNSQCLVSGAGSSVVGSGNKLTVSLALSFQVAFAGVKNIYLLAQDTAGLATGWQMRGTWTVPGAGNQAPSAVSVTPSSGSGSSQTFSFLFSDANGFADLPWAQLLVNATLSGVGACYLHYDRAVNAVYLYTDGGPAWLGPLALGAAGSLQNSQCVVNGMGSSASGSGNNLTVNLALSFKAEFTGAKNVYMLVQDTGGLTSGWQIRGAWTVP